MLAARPTRPSWTFWTVATLSMLVALIECRASQLHVGGATVRITPERPVALAGHVRKEQHSDAVLVHKVATIELPVRTVTETEAAEARANVEALSKDPRNRRLVVWHGDVDWTSWISGPGIETGEARKGG
jgi:hypothetical protein